MLELNYTLYTSFPLILWDYRIIVASFRYCHFSHPVGTNINQVIIALSIPYHNWFPRLTKLLSSLMKTLSYTNVYISFPSSHTQTLIEWFNEQTPTFPIRILSKSVSRIYQHPAFPLLLHYSSSSRFLFRNFFDNRGAETRCQKNSSDSARRVSARGGSRTPN